MTILRNPHPLLHAARKPRVVPLDSDRERLMRRPEVERVTGLSRSEIYRRMAVGCFPKCVRLGVNCVAWAASDIDRWVAARIAERGQSNAA